MFDVDDVVTGFNIQKRPVTLVAGQLCADPANAPPRLVPMKQFVVGDQYDRPGSAAGPVTALLPDEPTVEVPDFDIDGLHAGGHVFG